MQSRWISPACLLLLISPHPKYGRYQKAAEKESYFWKIDLLLTASKEPQNSSTKKAQLFLAKEIVCRLQNEAFLSPTLLPSG